MSPALDSDPWVRSQATTAPKTLEDSPYFDDEAMIIWDEYWQPLMGDAWGYSH